MEKAKHWQSVIAGPIGPGHSRAPVWLALVLIPWLAACARPGPEQRLRDQLAQMQEAVEQQRSGDAMSAVAEDFRGKDGMDRAALHNLMRLRFIAGQRIGVATGPLDVTLRDGTATVRFDAVLSGSGQGRWLPDSAQAYTITTGWRLQDGDWRLYYADWQTRH